MPDFGGKNNANRRILGKIRKRVPKEEKKPCHVFQATGTTFELVQNIIGTNLLTKKNTPPLVAMTNLLTKFHKDRKINVASRVKNAPPPGSHVFQPTSIIFERIQDIIGVSILTKFHEDRTIHVASRVLTRFYYSHTLRDP
ncbi:hypothetical protein DPMN_030833 [Dreissena polymorpha]|uniref:Uncharacterized protein n=1 Tax=Dreissena polymorpha TaxID=45954 RepID=A0A9D4M0Q1_DREPO|nr:hypothetical protein DPMN_030833 [Dreissena polymorpha]